MARPRSAGLVSNRCIPATVGDGPSRGRRDPAGGVGAGAYGPAVELRRRRPGDGGSDRTAGLPRAHRRPDGHRAETGYDPDQWTIRSAEVWSGYDWLDWFQYVPVAGDSMTDGQLQECIHGAETTSEAGAATGTVATASESGSAGASAPVEFRSTPCSSSHSGSARRSAWDSSSASSGDGPRRSRAPPGDRSAGSASPRSGVGASPGARHSGRRSASEIELAASPRWPARGRRKDPGARRTPFARRRRPARDRRIEPGGAHGRRSGAG